MATIVTRAGKGSPLTHTEVDTNFTNLNTNKLEAGAIALGSAATPSISFTGDTNTGIYSPGADTLAFVTAGSNRVHITSGGLVGIGTSSPSAKLDVEASNFAGAPAMGVRYNTSNVRLGFNIGNGNGFTYIGSNTNNKLSSDTATYDLTGHPASQLRLDSGQLVFNNAPSGTAGNDITFTNRLTITSGGLVGIGTTGPSNQAHIYRTDSGTHNGALRLDGNGGYAGVQFAISGTNYGSICSDTSSLYITHASNISFRTGGSGNVGGTDRACIDSSGRLLVGTSTAFVEGFNNALTASQLSKGSGNNVRCISDTRSVAAVNNSTVDAWVGRNAAGNAFTAAMAGHFYVQVGGADNFSGVYSIVTSSLGTSAATLTAVSTVTRGTSPVSSVQIANDGAVGAIKLTITYINNAGVVNGLTSYVSFVGLAG